MTDTTTPKAQLLFVHRDPDATGPLTDIASALELHPTPLAPSQLTAEEALVQHEGCLVVDHSIVEPPFRSQLGDFMNAHPAFPVVVWAGALELPQVVHAFRQGVVDVLHKPVENSLLRGCIERAAKMGRERALLLKKNREVSDLLAQLMRSERDVLNLLLLGKTNKEISYRLECSQRTVETRRQRILRLLQADNAIQLGKIMGEFEMLQNLSRMQGWIG